MTSWQNLVWVEPLLQLFLSQRSAPQCVGHQHFDSVVPLIWILFSYFNIDISSAYTTSLLCKLYFSTKAIILCFPIHLQIAVVDVSQVRYQFTQGNIHWKQSVYSSTEISVHSILFNTLTLHVYLNDSPQSPDMQLCTVHLFISINAEFFSPKAGPQPHAKAISPLSSLDKLSSYEWLPQCWDIICIICSTYLYRLKSSYYLGGWRQCIHPVVCCIGILTPGGCSYCDIFHSFTTVYHQFCLQ